MPRVELQRVFELLRRSPIESNKEKLPLASNRISKDNGSIPKIPSKESTAHVRQTEGTSEEERKRILDVDKDKLGPMTFWRKFCFLMSFNVPILYFLTFAWFIPCAEWNCPDESLWNVTFKNKEPSTDLEAVGNRLVIIGFSDLYGVSKFATGSIAAFETSTGSLIWNDTLNFIPSAIHCSDLHFDVNEDGIPDCIVTGNDTFLAINTSDGYIFWQQNHLSQQQKDFRIGISYNCADDTSRIGITGISNGGEKIFLNIFLANNGTHLLSVPLPCDAIPLKMQEWSSTEGKPTQIAFVCYVKGGPEVWTGNISLLCSTKRNDELLIAEHFSQVYSFGRLFSSSGVASLAALTPPQSGILLAWGNAVAMVTGDKQVTWSTLYNGSLVTHVLFGRFSMPFNKQLIIGLHNTTSNIIEISLLDQSTGEEINSITMGQGKLLSLGLISEVKRDFALAEKEEVISEDFSIQNENQTFPTNEVTEGKKQILNVTYYIVDFSGLGRIRKIMTAPFVYDSVVIPLKYDDHLLILAQKGNNGDLKISGYSVGNWEACS